MFQFVIQDRQRRFEAFHDVDVLDGRLVHERIFLNCADQFGDPRRAAFYFVQQVRDL